MALPRFALQRPRALDEALALIGGDALPYVGGTELLLAMRMGLLRPAVLVDLKRVGGLADIRFDGARLTIGAATTHDDIARHPLVAEHCSLLAAVEHGVGNARVRAQGSIGGNICFAEPRSDLAAALVALSAELELRSARGTRTVAAREFFLGPYWTVREADELLTAIHVPVPAATGVYRKFQTVERPTVSVAAVSRPDGGFRVVVGAVGDKPLWFDADELTTIAPDEIASAVEPVADLVGSVRYKRHMTEVFVRRAIDDLAGAAR
jgi:carbon-monoxide dehydrogenase medium subunit